MVKMQKIKRNIVEVKKKSTYGDFLYSEDMYPIILFEKYRVGKSVLSSHFRARKYDIPV